MIDKASGGETCWVFLQVRDRLAQTVCKMILNRYLRQTLRIARMVFDRDASSKDAITAIKEHLKDGKTEVYDAT